MKLYHATTPDSATAILAGGFRNSKAVPPYVGAGVWLADKPEPHATTQLVRAQEVVMLMVEVPDDLAAEYLFHGSPGENIGRWLEFCIPAKVVNELDVTVVYRQPL